MIYKPFSDLQLSTLGMGNMRLPKTGVGEAIDEIKARQVIEYAYENGINYFDTAYRYHAGESELFVGKVLNQYPRESWYLASKMPGHAMRYENGKFEFFGLMAGHPPASPPEIFEKQLKKCGVDYFDFYMLHNLCETSYDFYTNEDVGVVEYLLEQKKAGRIRHLGFSAHGRAETIDNFLNWNTCFDFVQIQLNYMDWTLQDAKKKYEVITNHSIPVFVMEPVRGGRLAALGAEADAMLKNARPNDTIISWAFRFLQSLPNVQVVLSGMNEIKQIADNIATFSAPTPMTELENELLQKAVSSLVNMAPCTACRYCCEGCPKQLDIPKLISLYNEMSFEPSPGLGFSIKGLKSEELPSTCISCRNCVQACPQGIEIPDIMEKMSVSLRKYQ